MILSQAAIIKTGEYLLIVRNRVALESRYGAGLPIAGEWEADNKLDNAGENIKLSFGAGTPIIEVTYDDKEPWPISADGDGFTLNLTDPKKCFARKSWGSKQLVFWSRFTRF